MAALFMCLWCLHRAGEDEMEAEMEAESFYLIGCLVPVLQWVFFAGH